MWERSHTILLYTTDAPKGIKDSLAILKHCFPIGMPRIVMHQRQPRMQYPIAISRPKKMIQIMMIWLMASTYITAAISLAIS